MAPQQEPRLPPLREMADVMRRYSTAVVLFHYTMADRLGLGPTDHKCFDLLTERGALTGSELAAITGLTTGAVTGVVTRLERAGYLRREADLADGRKQYLHARDEKKIEVQKAFYSLHTELTELLRSFNQQEVQTIKTFLQQVTALSYRQIGLMRGEQIQVKGNDSYPATRTSKKKKRAQ